MKSLFDRPKLTLVDALKDAKFDADHPDVWATFVRVTGKVRASGATRFSADAVLHQMRWERMVEGSAEYVVNNIWSAYLARRYLREHPDAIGFFELRKSAVDGGEG